MTHPLRLHLSRSARIGIIVAGVVGLITGSMAWVQVQRERAIDLDDLDRRAHALAQQVGWPARSALRLSDTEAADLLKDRIEGYRRVVGFAVFRPDGRLIAAAPGVSEFIDEVRPLVAESIARRTDVAQAVRLRDSSVHVYASCLTVADDAPLGAVAVVHDMSFIEQRATSRLVLFGFGVLLLAMLLVTLVVGINWAAYERPLGQLADWMRRLRTEDAVEAPPRGLPFEHLASESDRLAASFRAARNAGWRDSRETVREHATWTRDRLRTHAVDVLQGRQLVVVSNREPYMHQFRNGVPHMIVPAGGLVTALDPVLQACGGIWVAHGAGDADRRTSDASGRLMVPPDDPRYTLRRVWLSRAEEQGYYYGLSNEGLWPLCHLAHERPVFRATDWESYVQANQRFADAVLDEVGAGPASVLVQDYQLALVPAMLKAKRPDLRVCIFWHIPWPNPEAFRICPWRAEILQGMLGADVIGFHLQQYCNNFLDTVDRMVEARLDWDHFAVELRGHRALVRPFPISIESWEERDVARDEALEARVAALRAEHHLGNARVIAGVERIDYTKGLPERLRAFGRFLEKYPKLRGEVVFVLLGAPSRTHLRRYRDLIAELETMADEINWKHQTESWKPIRLMVGHHDAATVHAFLRMADVCVVSPLHDGMNLVAKEYVAAQPDGAGALVLSEFAGAARELYDALLINPYDAEQFAETIYAALVMPDEERTERMRSMQLAVQKNNVYRWAAKLLSALADVPVRSGRAATPDLLMTS